MRNLTENDKHIIKKLRQRMNKKHSQRHVVSFRRKKAIKIVPGVVLVRKPNKRVGNVVFILTLKLLSCSN